MNSGIARMMVVVVALSACGAEDTVDVPAGASIRGVIDGLPGEAPARPYVGLVYPGLGEGAGSYVGDSAKVKPGFPAEFDVELARRPPAGAVGSYWNEDGSEDARMALAFVMAFDDVDGDGTWKEDAEGGIAPDRLLGISLSEILIYVEREPVAGGAAEAVFVNPEDATVGYHLAQPVCGDGETGGQLRILGEDAEVNVVVPESEEGVEFPCLDFAWPTAERPL